MCRKPCILSLFRVLLSGMVLMSLCSQASDEQGWLWNNPHVQSPRDNVYFSAFVAPPKTLDPARAYEENEITFIAQIYETPLQYAYLTRPYTLVPLLARALPVVHYYDKNHQRLPSNALPVDIAYTTYDINIRPGIYYEPHPALARQANGRLIYASLSARDLAHRYRPLDFPHQGTREVVANDFVYAIKRLADPTVNSPIYGLMSRYIIGLNQYHQLLQQHSQWLHRQSPRGQSVEFINLNRWPLSGAQVLSRYHYRITVTGFYPQFKYWLSMPFFAPMPWEAVAWYAQPGMAARNLTLNEYPVGTGPYRLVKHNPNQVIELARNPHFRGERYPSQGSAGDARLGYLRLAGKTMPFIDRFIFNLEKENIPRWQKFLQGYYDRSSVAAEGFDQAIQFNAAGRPMLTTQMRQQGIYLHTTVGLSDFYVGFNMKDPVVGGYSEQRRALRQAIAIALNEEEYIAIFLNGRGIPAQGPLPPGVFGYQRGQLGTNPYVYDWVNGRAQRKPLAVAKMLLAKAGYPQGRDPKTGRRLILNYDTATTGGPDEYAQFNWLRKQFAQLGIELNVRATLPNRFEDKVLSGNVQLFNYGWNADYPDPENFLFLFYGPNDAGLSGGQNQARYHNAQVDQLYQQIAQLPDGPARQQKINTILDILRRDSPWIWGFHPIAFTLSHTWLSPAKPSAVANNVLKYYALDPQKRNYLLHQWNRPLIWPLAILLMAVMLLLLPLVWMYYRRQHRPAVLRYVKSCPLKDEKNEARHSGSKE